MSTVSASNGYFWFKRLHSLSGVVLSFAYIFFFLIPYSAAITSPESFNRVVSVAAKIPLLGVFEFFFILLPIMFFILMGLDFIYRSEFNILSYGTYRNWMYALERISIIASIPFIFYHIYHTRLLFAFTGKYIDYAYMQKLIAPWHVKFIYFVGVMALAFHVGNGFAFTLSGWGVTASKKAQTISAEVMWVITLIVALWGARIIIAF